MSNAENVVLSDKAVIENGVPSFDTYSNAEFRTILGQLQKEASEFEVELARTNQSLYKLLGRCYMYWRAYDVSSVKQNLRAEFVAWAEERGLRVSESTPFESLLLKRVWNLVDRRRISIYKSALAFAEYCNIASVEGFVELMNAIGGVEEASKALKDDLNVEDMVELKDLANEIITADLPCLIGYGDITTTDKVETIKLNDVSYAVFVATPTEGKKNTFTILKSVKPSSTIINACALEMAKQKRGELVSETYNDSYKATFAAGEIPKVVSRSTETASNDEQVAQVA
jgi:hypothetical protein